MFVSFDPLVLLLWVFVTCFLPGSLLSLALFRGSRFNSLEKVLIGFGLGAILVPLVPFLLFFLAGVTFSFAIAVFSVALFYAVALAFFIRNKVHEDFQGVKLSVPQADGLAAYLTSSGFIISSLLVLVVVAAFVVRASTYSPVFMELDPYYYTYVAQQVVVQGGNFLNDKTAWVPDLVEDHRTVPELSYLEGIWYTFYTGGGKFDNLLLADVASFYPPLLSALAAFFIYLFVSNYYKREWGLLAAGLAAFIPIYVIKTLAGEMEVQPYAFFAISMFLAMYAIMLKDKTRLAAVLAAFAYIAVAMGSSSELVVVTVLLLFIPLQSMFTFLKEKENHAASAASPQSPSGLQGSGPLLKEFVINNAIILVIGVLLVAGVVKGIFYAEQVFYTNFIAVAAAIAFSAALFAIRTYLPDQKAANKAFIAMLLAGLFIFFFTPVGDVVKNIGAAGLGVVRYQAALDRTIAEQGSAGSDFFGEFGFIASSYPGGIDAVMNIITTVVNVSLDLAVRLINWLLDTSLTFDYKSNSLLMLWIALFWAALVYSLYRSYKEPDYGAPALLFAVLVLPPLLIGLLKAKYTIYAGFLMAAAIGFTFGELEGLLKAFARKSGKDEAEKAEYVSYAYYGLAAIAGLVLLLQFTASYGGMAKALFISSFEPRFQDNPMALQAKFQSMCNELNSKGATEQSLCDQYRKGGINFCREAYDPSICAVAADPAGFANQGTNMQYNRKLCYYSLIADIFNPEPDEVIAANFRCERIEDYWVEAMEWLRYDTGDGSRTISWWDYGHWINFFGQKNTVLRNEHASNVMINEVAHGYIDAPPEELSSYMLAKNSSYALFDMELTGGFPFGGKYGALNYLSCVRDNNSDVTKQPGLSVCEAEHLWEIVYVPVDATGRTCTISKSGNKTGVIGYEAYWTYNISEPFRLSAMYPNIMGFNCYGTYLNDPTTLAVCQNYVRLKPTYCIGPVLMANGQTINGTYLLNETAPNGDLKLNRGLMQPSGSYQQTFHLGDVKAYTMIYDKRPIWLENGQVSSGFGDARTEFYDSNLYQALYTDSIPGFTKVFQTRDGQVKIYSTD